MSTPVTRRSMLAGTAVVCLGALAGCSAPARSSPPYEVTTDQSLGETHVHFRDGDEDVAVATFRVTSSVDGTARIGASLSHNSPGVTDYRLLFRVDTASGDPAQVALRRPAAALPGFVFRPADDHDWTEFRVDDFGDHGEGTVNFDFDVFTTEPTDRLTVFIDLRATLTGSTAFGSRPLQATAEARSRQV